MYIYKTTEIYDPIYDYFYSTVDYSISLSNIRIYII